MYRFGPALEANRFEKLFYWPDPRGRALRQVRKGLDSQDPTLLSIETLAKKVLQFKVYWPWSSYSSVVIQKHYTLVMPIDATT